MTASHVRPASDPAGTGRLHAFYEDPGTTVSSGPDRARRQARMLAAVLAQRSGPQRIVDVGCGDGTATHLVKRLDPRNTVIGVDWSAMALVQARARGLLVDPGRCRRVGPAAPRRAAPTS